MGCEEAAGPPGGKPRKGHPWRGRGEAVQGGPSPWVIAAMLGAGLAAVAGCVAILLWLAAPAMVRATRLAARVLYGGAGAALCLVALLVFSESRRVGSTWFQVHGEEAAFWLMGAGLGTLAAAFLRRRSAA